MTLRTAARQLAKTAFVFSEREGLVLKVHYRRMKGAINQGDRLAIDPAPSVYELFVIDNAPAHALERATQGDMRTTENRPERSFLLDWFQVETYSFVPAENDELDVEEDAGTVRYRIDQIASDSVRAVYELSCRRTGG